MSEILQQIDNPRVCFMAAAECKFAEKPDEEKGRAAVKAVAFNYNETTRHGWQIKPNALKESLAAWEKRGQKIPMLMNHRLDEGCGVWNVWTNTRGSLQVEGYISTIIPKGKEAYALVSEGIVQSVSISFMIHEAERSGDYGEFLMIHEAELVEISLTPCPMQAGAKLKKLSFDDFAAHGDSPIMQPPPLQKNDFTISQLRQLNNDAKETLASIRRLA